MQEILHDEPQSEYQEEEGHFGIEDINDFLMEKSEETPY